MNFKKIFILGVFVALVIKKTNKKLKNIGPCSPEMEDILERRRKHVAPIE